MTTLNKVGAMLGEDKRVHALTDVTGFGLAGHLLEVCRGSGLAARVRWADVPVMTPALELAQQGIFPGAVTRNLESYGHDLTWDTQVKVRTRTRIRRNMQHFIYLRSCHTVSHTGI